MLDLTISTFRDVCEGIFDGPHATPRKTDAGPIFLGISCLNNGRLELAEAEHISEDSYRKWTRRVTPRSGDIVFSYETRIGEAAMIPAGLQCCLGRRLALLRPDADRIDPRFLLYYYLSPDFQDFLRSRTISGSTVDRIALSELPGFPIVLPSLEKQRAIAELLGALDDKIALNRRMHHTLETMAAALFRSWFLDFDPVTAKAEGRRAIGVPLGVHEAMPSRFTSGSDNELPDGWRVGCFEELGHLSRSQATPGEITTGTPYIAMDNMPRHSIAIDCWEPATRVDSAKTRYSRGDVLFGKLRPYFHKVGIAPNDGVCSTEILVIRPASPEWYGLLVCLASSTEFVEYASAAAEGTRMPRVSWNYLGRYALPLPPLWLADQFTSLARPLFDKIVAGVHESRTLAALRDALLPQLLSGAIRLRDAERVVIAAV